MVWILVPLLHHNHHHHPLKKPSSSSQRTIHPTFIGMRVLLPHLLPVLVRSRCLHACSPPLLLCGTGCPDVEALHALLSGTGAGKPQMYRIQAALVELIAGPLPEPSPAPSMRRSTSGMPFAAGAGSPPMTSSPAFYSGTPISSPSKPPPSMPTLGPLTHAHATAGMVSTRGMPRQPAPVLQQSVRGGGDNGRSASLLPSMNTERVADNAAATSTASTQPGGVSGQGIVVPQLQQPPQQQHSHMQQQQQQQQRWPLTAKHSAAAASKYTSGRERRKKEKDPPKPISRKHCMLSYVEGACLPEPVTHCASLHWIRRKSESVPRRG